MPTTILLLLLLSRLSSPSAAAGSGPRRPEQISASRGAVAADDARCSAIGRNALRDGGNAVDAAVAAALCLGVVSSASSGIGGGAFLLLRLSTGAAFAFDMRETSPRSSSQNMYAGNAAAKSQGPLSIAVPGELAGLHEVWRRHGKLPWKRLVFPAIRLADRGFKVSPYLRMQMEKTESGILADSGLREVFASSGQLLRVGDVCRQRRLAATLRAIARRGPAALYNGSIGVDLIRDIHQAGGILSMKDLQEYKVKVHEPLSADVMGVQILGMPPPSAGGAGIILMLNILSQYGIPWGVSGSLGLHRIIESQKHYFALKMNLGDPDFVNVSNVVHDMLSHAFASQLKRTILDNVTFGPTHYGGRWNIIDDHGTSHLCVVDDERNAVSMTSTVNSYFGSQMMSPSTGILLNNEMDDFSVPGNSSAVNVPPPAPANFIRPFKRPLSSMSPIIVTKDGELKAVVGASGGAMIPAAVLEVFLNLFAKGMDAFSSVLAPRVYHELIPNVVQYENWTTVTGDHFEVPAVLRADLQKKGHVLHGIAGGTICQLVVQNASGLEFGDLSAVSDPRKGGIPAGY